ncbi:hypothetical protein Tc00.1047053508139.110 [Trypanosoma cruzi]|uniref:Uncharacterized protein n=1 Tax=Trypanosoma cruzi (strain CL Brener) TaxID=353153 RepID=Q4E1F2_TRYCC|nr:uncharacterized protein Tc00.1047053508139.110 [Trypanosoma cruzi]EAN98597.1 hypothetical protein Tc00.1047053508139.110 [Trypanosoma cruzi]|eukprot:XP_820448.1 hypothetical protein Tc00.1047053508139.110 [Trypanosoma cruzi strain CL Brener]
MRCVRMLATRGNPSWYNCSDAAAGLEIIVCDRVLEIFTSDEVQKPTEGGTMDEGVVFTNNVPADPLLTVEEWWEDVVEKEAVTGEVVLATTPGAGRGGTAGAQTGEVIGSLPKMEKWKRLLCRVHQLSVQRKELCHRQR